MCKSMYTVFDLIDRMAIFVTEDPRDVAIFIVGRCVYEYVVIKTDLVGLGENPNARIVRLEGDIASIEKACVEG